MNFEDSSLWVEVQDIMGSKTDRRLYDYKATIHTTKEDFPVWDLHMYEVTRDYLTQVAEKGLVVFSLGLGDYMHRLYPFRSNLEITIKKIPVSENNNAEDLEGMSVVRYKAIFNPARNPPVGGSELEAMHPEDLNTKDFAKIHLEIIDRSAEVLRIKTTSGAYRDKKPEELIRSILGSESLAVRIDGKPSVDAIDIVEADNQEPISNTVFRSGKPISTIPTYLHEEVCGVYNAGIGTFFQKYKGKKTWFVYPTYDSSRFDKRGEKCIFYLVPQDRLPQLDRSYLVDGEVTKIVISGKRIYTDSSELRMINEGSGYRMADARTMMAKPVEMTPEGPRGLRTRVNHEVAIKSREDGLNYVPVVGGPSSNPYAERSRVLNRYMGQFTLEWENGNPDLIYPGMPCKIVYLSNGKLLSLKGTVLFVTSLSQKKEKYNASPFKNTTRIDVACDPKEDIPAVVSKETVGD